MIISVLTDVLKTKQSHHKGRRRNLKDADIEIEAERTNTVDQRLMWLFIVQIYCVYCLKYFGLERYGTLWNKEVINEYHRKSISIWWIQIKTALDHEHGRRQVYNPPCTDVLVDQNVNVFHWSIRWWPWKLW